MEGAQVIMKPVLVTTDVAATFIVKCKNQEATTDNVRAAREHIYYLAKQGQLTRHGGSARGKALWDLHELVRPYRSTWTVIEGA